MTQQEEIRVLLRGIEQLHEQSKMAATDKELMDIHSRMWNLQFCLNKLCWQMFGQRDGEGGLYASLLGQRNKSCGHHKEA
jgi:hypothetical protein